LSSQLGGTAQAARNINDGLSLTETASGGLDQITDSLQRIRELSVQAANGTNSASDLQSIQNEINQLNQGINDITRDTNFNGQQLFGGSFSTSLQVGPNVGDTKALGLGGTDTSTLGISSIDVTTAAGAAAAIDAADSAINSISSQQANIGAVQAGLNSTLANLNNTYENIAATRSRGADNDYAKSSTILAASNVQGFVALKALKAYAASQGSTLRLIDVV
jgi:flagellin